MTKTEIYAELQAWERVQKGLESQLELFYDLTGAQPDSELLTAIYAVAEAHTNAIERIIGDEMQWCDWWKYECQYGEKPMQAANLDKRLRKIKTLKQLARLISE